MAGCGRNLELLLAYFTNIEMIERNKRMANAIKSHSFKLGAVYEQDVKYFKWGQKAQSYDCIFCIWGLGYLKRGENLVMLAGIKRALKSKGSIIFFESVLP
jgi:hypothetical protein